MRTRVRTVPCGPQRLRRGGATKATATRWPGISRSRPGRLSKWWRVSSTSTITMPLSQGHWVAEHLVERHRSRWCRYRRAGRTSQRCPTCQRCSPPCAARTARDRPGAAPACRSRGADRRASIPDLLPTKMLDQLAEDAACPQPADIADGELLAVEGSILEQDRRNLQVAGHDLCGGDRSSAWRRGSSVRLSTTSSASATPISSRVRTFHVAPSMDARADREKPRLTPPISELPLRGHVRPRP